MISLRTTLPAATAAFVAVAPQTGMTAPEALQRVGTMECTAEMPDPTIRPPTVFISCHMEWTGAQRPEQVYSGRLIDSDAWVQKPGPVELVWQVLAPQQDIAPERLRGDYDIASSLGYDGQPGSDTLLFGGQGDAIALKLEAPRVAAISPSVRLQLDLGPPGEVRF